MKGPATRRMGVTCPRVADGKQMTNEMEMTEVAHTPMSDAELAKLLVKAPKREYADTSFKGNPKADDGLWLAPGGTFVDHETPAGQRLAYELLRTGRKWQVACNFGGTAEPLPHGGNRPDRAFANVLLLVKAGEAWIKREAGEGRVLPHWKKPRVKGDVVAAEAAKAEAPKAEVKEPAAPAPRGTSKRDMAARRKAEAAAKEAVA